MSFVVNIDEGLTPGGNSFRVLRTGPMISRRRFGDEDSDARELRHQAQAHKLSQRPSYAQIR